MALLRGVNVGGRKLSMAALKAALEEAGCRDVVTYIQSGNVVLTPPKPAPKDLRAWLEKQISPVAGFDVAVVVRTDAELRKTIERNPYPNASGTQLHVVFFEAAPPKPFIDQTEFAPEEFTLVGKDLYLHLPNGMGRAKLPIALEKAGRKAKGDPGTARNWNTVLKLLEMATG